MNIKEKIISFIKENQLLPSSDQQLMDLLGIKASKSERENFLKILNELVKEGSLILTKKGKYGIPEQLGYIIGKIQGNPKGFGFLIADNKEIKDIFIAAENMNGAMHNDRVMVRMLKKSVDEKHAEEGEVYKIIEHANKKIVGTFEESKNFAFVVSDDPKIYEDVFIPKGDFNKAKNGDKVVAEITKWPGKRRNPEGKIIEVLGNKNDTGTDILSIIRQFELPEEFPEKVSRQAQNIGLEVPEEEIEKREDLRNEKIVTIDGDDAKDLDDAVSVKMLDNGNFMLGVHIADVSNYVKEGSAIDREAYKRGTSVYLVDRVIPMLPKELSNGICSLNPKENRLTLSVFMEINNAGEVVSYRIAETVIKTVERMTYNNVTKILKKSDPDVLKRYDYLIDDFELMKKLALILKDRRMKRGSIDFDIDEAKIELNEQGKPVKIEKYPRDISNQIIEEFMLVCNETVAEHMYWRQLPFVYRVHEEPDTEKLLDFNEFIHNFGYHLKGVVGEIHPKSLQDLLNEIRGTREEDIISRLMLRSLQKARYSSENLGHFGLAAQYYCHFTSPIRRYPDLTIHRIIKDSLHDRLKDKRIQKLNDILPELANQCSVREKVAMDAERATDDLKMTEYMKDKVGSEYDGIISGVTNYGFYVELENTIEGLVRASSLEDDFYVFDEKHYCMIGEHTKKIFRLGDNVRIKVASADVVSRKIDFVLADQNNNDTEK